ncbi:hypothetical protein AGIG_G14110 [Arapaima gigas]
MKTLVMACKGLGSRTAKNRIGKPCIGTIGTSEPAGLTEQMAFRQRAPTAPAIPQCVCRYHLFNSLKLF